MRDPKGYRYDPDWKTELESVSHREYGTGFFFSEPMDEPQVVSTCGYLREKAYFSTATEYHEEEMEVLRACGISEVNENGRLYRFIQRNKVSVGEAAELVTPGKIGMPFAVNELYAPDGSPLAATPHPSMIYWCRVPFAVQEGDILRAGVARGLEVRPSDC